jgi:hypothetical protein
MVAKEEEEDEDGGEEEEEEEDEEASSPSWAGLEDRFKGRGRDSNWEREGRRGLGDSIQQGE